MVPRRLIRDENILSEKAETVKVAPNQPMLVTNADHLMSYEYFLVKNSEHVSLEPKQELVFQCAANLKFIADGVSARTNLLHTGPRLT